MELYADFACLSSGSGASASAYSLLRQAGHHPDVIYVPRRKWELELLPWTSHREPPVLITDDGRVVGSLRAIRAWLGDAD